MNKPLMFLLTLATALLIGSCNHSPVSASRQASIADSTQAAEISATDTDTGISRQSDQTASDIPVSRQDQVAEQRPVTSCKDLYKQLQKKPQAFSVNNTKDTLLTCAEGTTLSIRANTFIYEKTGKAVSGNVRIDVTEYYRISDMLLADLTTT